MDHERARRHLFEEMQLGTPRAARARRFAQAVMSIVRDFIPRDRDCFRVIEDRLLAIGYETNAEIIAVPDECDAMDNLMLERRMRETSLARVALADAAPDLLAALKRVVAVTDRKTDEFDAARAAIAKAEGRG